MAMGLVMNGAAAPGFSAASAVEDADRHLASDEAGCVTDEELIVDGVDAAHWNAGPEEHLRRSCSSVALERRR